MKKKLDYYKDKNEEEMEKHINKKVGELPFHQFLQLFLNDLLWDFDAVRFYPSAMSDEKFVFLKIETGYAFTPNMKKKSH